MLRFPQETLTEVVAFLLRFDLDAVDMTSHQFRRAVSALSAKPLRRLDVVSLTDGGAIIVANGLRHSFGTDELRVSFDEILRLTNDSVFVQLQIQFISRESESLVALRRLLSDRLTITLRMSYADVSACDTNDILRISSAVVTGGSVLMDKVCMARSSARQFMRSLAAKGLRSLKMSRVCSGGGCTGRELLAFVSSSNADAEPRHFEVEDWRILRAAKTGKLCDFDARISDRSVPELDMSGFEPYRTTRPTFLESVAEYEFRTLGLKLTFPRDSTELLISHRKTEK